jgi:hypothetical protein
MTDKISLDNYQALNSDLQKQESQGIYSNFLILTLFLDNNPEDGSDDEGKFNQFPTNFLFF